ncbi:MAG TPA: hypothetical protein VM662_02880 [Sphingomonas sp.]|nr:hypothetical protein [Sphingomonas sp.]
MRGEALRQRHAMLTQLAPDTRGARFARRVAGEAGPSFADLAKLPDWLSVAPERFRQIAALAALLKYRAAIDAELSGPRLARVAEAVGENLLDAACAAEPSGEYRATTLPPPERLLAEGEALLEAGLPACFASRFPRACDDAAARGVAAKASAIAEALA